MTLAQHAMQYEARTRQQQHDNNGPRRCSLRDGPVRTGDLAAPRVDYDAVNGQQIYVNGTYTGDADPGKGGRWAIGTAPSRLVLGNETTGKRPWQGVIKFAAIHGRALTAAQVQQNFAAGVGERYYLLFNVSAITACCSRSSWWKAASTTLTATVPKSPAYIISLDPNAGAGEQLRLSANPHWCETYDCARRAVVCKGECQTASPKLHFRGPVQLLSNVGAVNCLRQGSGTANMFFPVVRPARSKRAPPSSKRPSSKTPR